MSLYKKMVQDGHTMFRWRSYLPLLFIGPLLFAFEQAAHIEALVGDKIEDLWVLFCFLLSLAGIAIRAITVGYVPGSTSGRNTTEQRASFLNTKGMYSVVRNPLYFGNFIIILGCLLSIKVWWLVLIASLVFFIYMERIILTEEDYLEKKFGESYDSWRAKTPVIIPNMKLWEPAGVPFSWKTVLKREYPGLLAVGTVFFVTEIIVDLAFEKEAFSEWVHEDIIWPITYALIVTFCLTLRHLKKHTKLLKVEGR